VRKASKMRVLNITTSLRKENSASIAIVNVLLEDDLCDGVSADDEDAGAALAEE
jgi:hypothetical protein